MIDYKKDIENKILLLGGTQENPSCGEVTANKVEKSEGVYYLESLFDVRLPEEYVFFYEKYGPSSFKNRVQIRSESISKVVSNDGRVSVDYFYSVARTGSCSIGELLSDCGDQLPQSLLPICDGESGDLICIDLSGKNYGRIYYWFHEGDYEENSFLIARDFYSFVMALEIYDDYKEDTRRENSKSEYTITPELLALLKKSGYGPKE